MYTPKAGTEEWSKNCYNCWKAGKVPKTGAEKKHDEIMNALREIYDLINKQNESPA